MKKLLRLMLLAALFVPLGAQAQNCPGANPVTVSNADTSSGTTSYIPGYSTYNYSYTEVIIPAERLTGIGTIQALQFKPASTSAGSYFTNCEVYLALTSDDDLSAGWSTAGGDLELVWSGDMSYTTTDWQTLTFDNPFTYDGVSNIVVAVVRGHGSWQSGSSFAAFTASAQLARYAYTDNGPYTAGNPGATGTATSTVAWYKLLGCDNVPVISCNRIRDLYADAITINGATLHWLDTSNSNATYTIFNMADTSVIATDISDTFYTVNTLNSNTVYTLGVVAVCGAGDTSALSRVTLRTACGAIDSLPYFQDFEGETEGSTTSATFIPCYNRFTNGTSMYPYVYNYSYYSRSGSKLLYWYVYGGSASFGSKWLAALPVINTDVLPMNTLQLRFWARTSSATSAGIVQVGVMTDFYNDSTFVPVQTLTIDNTSYREFTVPMVNVPDSAVCMAFRYLTPGGGQTYRYVYIDDITIEAQPSCPNIAGISLVGSSPSGAILSWSTNPGANAPESYVVSYRNIADSSAVAVTDTVTTTTYAITGLTPATRYEFIVIANCGDNGLGAKDSIIFATTDFGCVVVDTNTSTSDTIATGGETTAYFPCHSNWNYSLTQQIYSPTEVGASGRITSISFLPTTVNMPVRNIEIYLGHVSQSTLTGFVWPSDLTMVYSGSTALVANQWAEFVFSTGFDYNGSSNLLVVVRDMTGSYISTNYWSVHAVDNGTTCYAYQDDNAYPIGYAVGTPYGYRNDIVFGKLACAQTATCAAPVASVADVQSDEVTLSWLAGASETEWDIYYRVSGDTAWTEVTTGVSSLTYTVENLNPGTTYQFRVVNSCSEGTFESIVSATTLCAAFALPLTENFESLSTGTVFNRPCWTVGSTQLGNSYPLPLVVSLTGSDNKLCILYNGGYMVLPKANASLDQLELSFKLTQGADSVRLLMGLLPEANSPIDSIIVLDTLIRSVIDTTTSTVNITYRFDTIDPAYSNYNIVFWDAFNDNYNFVDDIVLDYIPACGTVSSLSAVATASDATISWTVDGENATSYTVEYGPRGFTPGTGTTITATGSPVILSGLNHSTNYDAYVYSECASLESTSAPSQVVMFSTECQPYTTFPYFVNFENIVPAGTTSTSYLPNCWVADANGGNPAYVYYTTTASYTSSPSYCLYVRDTASVVALPEMNVPLSTLMLSFHVYNGSPSTYGLVVGAVTQDTGNFAQTFVPIDTLRFQSGVYQYDQLVYLTNYTGTASRLALRGINRNGYSSSYLYIDDLTVSLAPACIAPQRVRTTAVSNTTADLAWEISTAGSYNVEYGPTGFTPGTGLTTTTTSRSVSLTGLTAATTYDVRIVGVCDTVTSDTTLYSFSTLRAAPVTTLPYICTFADAAMANEWELVGDNQANSWYIGSDAHADATDTIGLYVSADTGATNSYNTSSTSFSYAYRVFTLDTGAYAVSFDWTGQGESSYDYLRAFIAPASFVPQAGLCPDGTDYAYTFATVVPTGMIDLGGKMNLSSSWNSALTPFTITTPGDYVLFFFWANDGSAGTQPPAAVDNVMLYVNSCPWPENIVSTAATPNSLTIDWTDAAAAASWQIEYGPRGFVQGTGTIVSATDHPVTINGLTSQTTYDVYVRPICSTTDTGMWSPCASFATSLCDNATIVDNFSSINAPTTSYYSPIGYCLYNYSYTQTIIPASDLAGLTSPVSAISFLPTSVTSGNYFTGMSVYMANVTEETLSAGFIMPNDSNHVFVEVISNANFSFSTTDWQIHSLNTPFVWDGSSNILVAVTREHGEWSSSATFRAHTDTLARMRYAYDDYNPFDVTDASLATDGTSSNTIGDIRLISCQDMTCDAPAILSDTVGENDATITFSATAEDFEVAILEGIWNDTAATPIATTDTVYTFTGLTANTQYTIGVRAICGSSTVSDWVTRSVTTAEHPCFVPTGVTVSNITFDGATIAWTPGENETTWEINITGPSYDQTFTTTTNPYAVSGLASNELFTVRVRALCSATQQSDWSQPAQFTTERCQPVTGVTATATTFETATVSWNPASNGSGNYEVEYGLSGFRQGDGTRVTVTGATNYAISGLDEETSYDVYVRSICTAGLTSEWSAVTTFTTPQSEGIQPLTSDLQPNIYPNPASTTVTLSGLEPGATVTIVDLNGREVAEFKIQNSEFRIDVTSLTSGAYFVRITGERQQAIRELIVK